MINPNFDTSHILSEYEKLEPGDSDAWNPVRDDWELTYRLSMFYCLTKAFRLTRPSLASLKVLDIGCGNGRSSRMYIDLGLKPEQITGVDLRANAIATAKKLNPGIHYTIYDGQTLPFTDHSFNWISISTVFSSIKTAESKASLVNLINQKLSPGGFIFYFDMYWALWFAGGEAMKPKEIFSDFKTIWHSPVKSIEFIPMKEKIDNLINIIKKKDTHSSFPLSKHYQRIMRHINPFSTATHEVLLLQKIK